MPSGKGDIPEGLRDSAKLSEDAGKIPAASPVIATGFGMLVSANHPEVIKDVIEDVIEGCRRGEPEAFRELFQSHKDMVYSIALRYSGDPAVAMVIFSR